MPSFLIADEDRNFREALAIALRLDGHAVSAVADAESAHARLAAGPVDCCLVDALLRGADGLLEAAERAGSRAFATGLHAELVAAAAARHPRAGALLKPLLASELEACLPRDEEARGQAAS